MCWHHTFSEEPIILYSEIDDEGWETRKVYIFRTGPPGIASSSKTARNVFLSNTKMPSISEIASDPQFSPREIDQYEFEDVWTDTLWRA